MHQRHPANTRHLACVESCFKKDTDPMTSQNSYISLEDSTLVSTLKVLFHH